MGGDFLGCHLPGRRPGGHRCGAAGRGDCGDGVLCGRQGRVPFRRLSPGDERMALRKKAGDHSGRKRGGGKLSGFSGTFGRLCGREPASSPGTGGPGPACLHFRHHKHGKTGGVKPPQSAQQRGRSHGHGLCGRTHLYASSALPHLLPYLRHAGLPLPGTAFFRKRISENHDAGHPQV